MELVTIESPVWKVTGDGSIIHSYLEVDAGLDLPFTVEVGEGVSATLYFRATPRIDPHVEWNGGNINLDLGECKTYFGFLPPPQDLNVDAGYEAKEAKARREFLAKLIKAAGDNIKPALDRLLALPGELFQALRTRVASYLDTNFTIFGKKLGILESAKAHIEALLLAVEKKVKEALDWLVSLARDVAKWLLTNTQQLASLGADVCRTVVEALRSLYEATVDGASQLGEVLQEVFVTMAKDAAKYAEQLRSTIVGLVKSAIVSGKEFAADVRNYVSAGLTELVKAYGMAEDKVAAFFHAVAQGVVEAAAKVGHKAREACDFFCRVLETAVAALEKVANDPSVLYNWVGKFIRIGLKAFVELSKAQAEWMVWAAHAIGRVARSLGSTIKDFAKKTADALEEYVKPALEAMAELAKAFGKATKKAFTAFLQKLAAWDRTLFHAVCRVLHAAEDLLVAIVGPKAIADVKEALKFLCTFLEEVGAKVSQAVQSLYRFGRFVAVDLPEHLLKIGETIGKEIAGFTSSLGAALEKAVHILVAQIGGYARNSPTVQALTAIVGVMLDLAEAAGAAIKQKGKQLGDWLRPRIDEAIAALEDMMQAVGALMEGTGDGSVLEARLRRLSIAEPRGSKRSQAKIVLLPEMPSAQKLPGDDVLLPTLQALAEETGLEMGALELLSFDDWRFSAPHPVSGLIDLAPRDAKKTRVLPVPVAPKKDVVFRVCVNPRLWVIDPRYSWGYGSSNQLHLADIDGDGKVDAWEAEKTADSLRAAKKKDPNADPFTAADLQTLLDQAKNVLDGVPYRQIGAPFGLLVGHEGSSWAWFSIASIGDEDVGAPAQSDADPKAKVGSVLRTGAGGTIIPAGEKVDRTGIGIFWQGMQLFGETNYPLHYHIEQRMFYDQFASGFGNTGTSTFLVLRGGKGASDFQLRGELYSDFTSRIGGCGIGLPIGMYTPTIRASFRFAANGGAGIAGQGGFRLGLEYASKAPIAVLMGDQVKDEDKDKSVVDKVLAKLKDDFKIDDILPLIEKAVVPLLRILMFDQEFEAKLACAGAIGVGADLAIEKKRAWAHQVTGRARTLKMLDRAQTFLDEWKQSEKVRLAEAALHNGEDESKSPKLLTSTEGPDTAADKLWADAGFNKEVHADLIEIQGLHRGFMRFALKEPVAGKPGLEERFASWLQTEPAVKLDTFEKWLAEQRQGRYLKKAGDGAQALKKQIWAGDFAGAWEEVQAAVARVDASTDEYADEICEAIIAVASLVDIFYRMAVALGNVAGVRKKITDDLKKRHEEAEKKAKEPPAPDGKRPPTILGRLGAEAHDDKWAQEVLQDAPSWGKQGTGLADGLSLVWSIDGGVGIGAGGSAGGAGLGAFAMAGLSVTPPSFKLPSELLEKLSSKLMLVRFGTKFVGALLEVINYHVTFHRNLPTDPGALLELAIFWCVQAVHQTLQEILNPGSTTLAPKQGRQADPLEEWLYGFLSGTTMSMGAKVEVLAKGTASVLSGEARAGLTGELSVTLASLLDPLVEAIQKDATPDPSGKAPLGARIIPKLSFKVKQDLSAGIAAGPAQLDVGLSGQSLTGDLVFPDGSPWRRDIEAHLAQLIQQAVDAAKSRGQESARQKQKDGFLHGIACLCHAVDILLRDQIPSIQDYEKKTGEEGPGLRTALVTNPSIQRMFAAIRDPASAQKREEKKKRIDELVEIIRKSELHFGVYPDQPHDVGVKANPAPSNAFDACVLLPDDEIGQLSPKTKILLERVVYRIPLDPAPAHVALDTFRRKNAPKEEPLNGIVVGFAKKSEAEAFAGKRKADWVDPSVASVPPWPSPRAGVSGLAQWYHWLNTKLFAAIEEARSQGKRLDQPRLSIDDKGVLLTFELVGRGLLEKEPFSTFGMVKESQTLVTEGTILEGAWEDDVVRLRTEVGASISRSSEATPSATEATPTASAQPATSPSSAGPTTAPAATATAPAAPAPALPDVPEPSAASSETLRYSVKRAQAAANHQLRNGGIPGWTKALSTDGHFGPKTGEALDAWGRTLGAPPVKAEKGDTAVEVSKKFAQALDEAHDKAVVAFAPPHNIPENDSPWMAIARGEIGQREIAGVEDNPRIREYHGATTMGEQPDEVAWCSSFVNWVFMRANLKRTRSASAASWANWGVESDPRRGAVVVLYNEAMKNSSLTRSGNHVGFLVEDVGWGWKVLGGNQSNMVKESCFSKKKWNLKAVRWPE